MAIHLKAARVNAGLTQNDVCLRINISKNTLISYEKYKSVPDIETAKKLAELYGMPVDNIIWSAE
jgi:DNA-binding XRE family transcriptional regulator